MKALSKKPKNSVQRTRPIFLWFQIFSSRLEESIQRSTALKQMLSIYNWPEFCHVISALIILFLVSKNPKEFTKNRALDGTDNIFGTDRLQIAS
jgi:hypothetical protein